MASTDQPKGLNYPDKRSLIRKLAEVMAEVGNVPKRGRNQHFNYDFVMEADLADAVRPALAKRHIMVFPDVVSCDMVDTGKGTVTRLRVAFTFVDGDSGEERTFHIVSDGLDGQDKGPSKALTGAVKYGLMKALLIGTGDDPEHDRGHPKDAPRKAPLKTGSGRVVASDIDVGALQAEARALGKRLKVDAEAVIKANPRADTLAAAVENMRKAAKAQQFEPTNIADEASVEDTH